MGEKGNKRASQRRCVFLYLNWQMESASSYLGRTFERAGVEIVSGAELKVVFYSWHPMRQVTFPHASGGSLRPSSVLEGGIRHGSRGRQCLWTAAVFCWTCCGSAGAISLSHCGAKETLSVFLDWLWGLGTFSVGSIWGTTSVEKGRSAEWGLISKWSLKLGLSYCLLPWTRGWFSVEERLEEMRWHRDDCCFQELKAPKASSQQTWIHWSSCTPCHILCEGPHLPVY